MGTVTVPREMACKGVACLQDLPPAPHHQGYFPIPQLKDYISKLEPLTLLKEASLVSKIQSASA